MPSRPWASWIPLLLSTLLPDVLPAQTVSTHSTQYWLTAGAGVGHMASSDTWVGETGTATSLAAIVQHRTLVASLRGVRTALDARNGWHVGALVGAGSPTRYAFRGSIAAGLGLAGGTADRADLTIPVDLQLGWSLSPALGLATVVFGNFGGPTQTVGVTFGLQIGRLR